MIITFDLDSTLADTRHRHHMINPEGGTDWRAYALACEADPIIEPVRQMWLALERDHDIWVVSARHRDAERKTRAWLERHGLFPQGMVLGGNGTGSHEDFKVQAVQRVRDAFGPVLFHVDDWPPVAVALRAAGFNCVTVTPPRVIDEFVADGHLTFV